MKRIHEVAADLLRQIGKPVASRDLAKLALDRGLVRSWAMAPIMSMASTIEKNIRDRIYNRPELDFVYTSSGRLIALAEWTREVPLPSEQLESAAVSPPPAVLETRTLSVQVPADLHDDLQLAVQLRIGATPDEVVVLALRAGLAALKPRFEEALAKQLDRIGSGLPSQPSNERAA